MSQQPGYNPSGQSGGGGAWWKWVLGGCGGCLLLVIIVMVAGGMWAKNFFGKMMKEVGPTTQASVQKNLGEVPLYPNGTLDLNATGVTRAIFVGVEKMAGKVPGAIFKGIAVENTHDDAEKVLSYYQETLPKLGWVRQESQSGGNAGRLQRVYRKGGELAIVQFQNRSDGQPGSAIVIMRGGPEMTKYDTRAKPGSAPAGSSP